MSRSFRSVLFRSTAIAASLFVLTACSSDGEGNGETSDGSPEQAASVDADTYAADVCGAIVDWLTSVEEGTTSLQEDIQGGTGDPQEAIQTFLDFLDEMIGNADRMIGEVESTSPPDVEDGEQFHERLVSLLQQGRTALQTGRDGIAELDASDPKALTEGLQEFGTAMQEATAGVENPLENTGNDQLDEAFAENEDCVEVEQMSS